MDSVAIEQLAIDLVRKLTKVGFQVRLFGGIAFSLQADWTSIYGYKRPAFDIDFVVPKAEFRKIALELRDEGAEFNSRALLIAAERLASLTFGQCRIDLYSDPLFLNQTIHLGPRLTIDYPTLSRADLVATKLQIASPRERDIQDLVALLALSELGETDDSNVINVRRLVNLSDGTWTFYYAAMLSLDRIMTYAVNSSLPEPRLQRIRDSVRTLKHFINDSPKSLAWKFRQGFGTSVKWYNIVDELGHDRKSS